MSSSTTVALTNAQAESLVTLILASLALVVVLSLAFYVLHVIAYWKMFTKAGEKGWKSIIPIYNMYIAFKIAWKDGKAFWIYLIATFATGIVSSFVVNADGSSNIIAALLATVVSIVALVWAIRFSIKQAHAYSKGTGCGILAIFFPNIMTLYYAFASSAVYAGPQD